MKKKEEDNLQEHESAIVFCFVFLFLTSCIFVFFFLVFFTS